jgi:hypothetical protein
VFDVSKGMLEEWRLAIGNTEFKKSSKLCDTHFLEEDIIKGKVIGGQFFHSKLWRLRKDAVPKLFLSRGERGHSGQKNYFPNISKTIHHFIKQINGIVKRPEIYVP